jgi:hypothetical protein
VQAQQAPRKGEQAAGAERGQQLPPPLATWHWHAHAVRCLAFSNDAAYLLSGGDEAAMVRRAAAWPGLARPCSLLRAASKDARVVLSV